MGTIQLIGSTLGLSFVAGLRLYATILALGLAIRFHWFVPSAGQQALQVLAHPAVLVSAGVAYFAEFFADKIPWIDSVWDTFHGVIRPLGAAVLAAAALGPMNPALKLTLIILCGSVALASHSSKAATRLVVNQSPEPFTNVGLSLLGDTLTPLGVWLSLAHPLIVLTLVVIFLGFFVWLAPKVYRSLRGSIATLRGWLGRKRLGRVARTAP